MIYLHIIHIHFHGIHLKLSLMSGFNSLLGNSRLESGDPRDMKTPLSTYKRFHRLPRSNTGLSNPGVFAGNVDLFPLVDPSDL